MNQKNDIIFDTVVKHYGGKFVLEFMEKIVSDLDIYLYPDSDYIYDIEPMKPIDKSIFLLGGYDIVSRENIEAGKVIGEINTLYIEMTKYISDIINQLKNLNNQISATIGHCDSIEKEYLEDALEEIDFVVSGLSDFINILICRVDILTRDLRGGACR